MARPQQHPLQPLSDEHRQALRSISRSFNEPAAHVARAKALLAVAEGASFTEAALRAGRKSGDAVGALVARFNRFGLAALETRHAGGRTATYTAHERQRILQELARAPDRQDDGTATWSLSLLRAALHKAPDGLSEVSTYTIWAVLHEAGYSWQRDRSWCRTGDVLRTRKQGPAHVQDPDSEAKKAHRAGLPPPARGGSRDVVRRWCEDEAGPFQTIPYAGRSWQSETKALCYDHEYRRSGTAKLMTLFHPATGHVRVRGTLSTTNEVLHSWMKQELAAIVARLAPVADTPSPQQNRTAWQRWQAGLSSCITLPEQLPPLRMLLVLDNLAGHRTPSFVLWLFAHGIMPLYTPLGGSWLNLAESIQRILKRRGLDGHHPQRPEEITAWLEATARGWNADPTVFVWGGKRAARRRRSRARRYAQGGSYGFTHRPTRRSRTALEKWQHARQTTH